MICQAHTRNWKYTEVGTVKIQTWPQGPLGVGAEAHEQSPVIWELKVMMGRMLKMTVLQEAEILHPFDLSWTGSSTEGWQSKAG